MNPLRTLIPLMLALFALPAAAQTSAFTYQGHLMDSGASANGTYDMTFTLKTALTGGSTVSGTTTQIVEDVAVTNGIFTTTIDFGSSGFLGGDRWLEMAVRPGASVGVFTMLAPRQKITSAPYAVRSINASVANSAVNSTNAVNLTGTITAGNVPANLITGSMLASGAVGTTQLAAGSVTSTQLAAGTVAFANLAKPPQSGTVSGSTLEYEFGRADFTVTFPEAYAAPPVVTLSLAPDSALFPEDATAQVKSVTSTGFTGRVTAQSLEDIAFSSHGSFAQPSLAIVDAFPAVSFFGSNNDLRYVRATNSDGTAWGTTVIVDNSPGVGRYSSMKVVNGNPAISYYDSSYGDLKYVRATNSSGTAWGTPVILDDIGTVGQMTSLAVVAGIPAVSYYDVSDGNLKYVRASDANGLAWPGTVTAVYSTDDVGAFNSLAVSGLLPAISYYDRTNGDLKYVRATNSSGTAWGVPVTVSHTGDVGSYCSMVVIDGFGFPAISYYDATNGDLKYVRATNSSGTAWGTPLTLDSTGDVGSFTSLAVINGNPAISYFDTTNTALKYIRAADPLGATWNPPVTIASAGDVGFETSLIEINSGPAVCCFDRRDSNSGKVRYFRQNPSTNFSINWIALPP